MNNINDFDQFLLELNEKIDNRPEERFRIILREMRKADCPYLRRKIKAHYLK